MEKIKKYERRMIDSYGELKKSETRVNDISLIVAIVFTVIYVAVLVSIGGILTDMNIFVRFYGSILVLGSIIVVPGLATSGVNFLSKKIFDIDGKKASFNIYQKLLNDYLERKEEEET